MKADKNTNQKDPAVTDGHVLMGLLAAFFVSMAISFWHDTDVKRENYTPGKSVSRKERAAVNAMADSTLNANIKEYKHMLHDHRVAYAHAIKYVPGAGRMKYEMHSWLRPNDDVRTVKDFYKYLKAYEQNQIEARYKELAKQK